MNRSFVCTLLTAVLSGSAFAQPTLDQAYDEVSEANIFARIGVLYPSQPYVQKIHLAQSFTVGLDGQLTHVDLYLKEKGTPTENLNINIVPLDESGVPQGDVVLASTAIVPGELGTEFAFHTVDFTTSNLLVTSGQQLAIVMESDQDFAGNVNEYAVDGNLRANYEGGDAWEKRNDDPFELFTFFSYEPDWFFRTYVDTSFGSDPIEETVESITLELEMSEVLLLELPKLNGISGLTSKLDDALESVQSAVDGLADGSLTEAEALALLDSARQQLEAYKNQVQGKMNGKKPQIPAAEGAVLLALADDAISLIDDLESLLSP